MNELKYLESMIVKQLKQGDAIREGASRGIIALEIIAKALIKIAKNTYIDPFLEKSTLYVKNMGCHPIYYTYGGALSTEIGILCFWTGFNNPHLHHKYTPIGDYVSVKVKYIQKGISVSISIRAI